MAAPPAPHIVSAAESEHCRGKLRCPNPIEPGAGLCVSCLASRLDDWVRTGIVTLPQARAIEATWRAAGLIAADALIRSMLGEDLP